MLELTPEQREALSQPGPVRLRDPETNETYFLVRAETYQRLEALLGGGDDWPRDAYRAPIEVFARGGWDDPRMDVYDEVATERRP